jgi:peptide/nickel transport system permease protein
MVLVLWVVGTATFFGMLGFGNPARMIGGPHASAREIASIARDYHLDQPRVVQYGYYLRGVARGDLGRSYRYHRPVASLLAERFPRTLLLGVMALCFELLLGVTIGTYAAAREGTRRAKALMAGTFLGISAPTFLTGKLALFVFAWQLGLAPLGGYGATPLEHIRHAVLPALVLATLGTAYQARIVRSELVDVLRGDFIRTARAKGLSEFAVVVKHGLRNALLPVITSVGLSFGSLFTGAIVTEAIFAWPGVGRLAYESITGNDLPTVMGTVLFASFGIQLGSLFADVTAALLDPRVRNG